MGETDMALNQKQCDWIWERVLSKWAYRGKWSKPPFPLFNPHKFQVKYKKARVEGGTKYRSAWMALVPNRFKVTPKSTSKSLKALPPPPVG